MVNIPPYELFQCYENCGKCCPQEGNVMVVDITLKDIDRLARNGLLRARDAREFFDWETSPFLHDFSLVPALSNPCPYFNHGSTRCDAYEYRPTICRIVPESNLAVDAALSPVFKCAHGKSLRDEDVQRYTAERRQFFMDFGESIGYFGAIEIRDPRLEGAVISSKRAHGCLPLNDVIETARNISKASKGTRDLERLMQLKADVEAKLEARIAEAQANNAA